MAATPAPGHVDDVYNSLLAVLVSEEVACYQDEGQDALEMRFVLRKFVAAALDLATAGSSDKEAYIEAAQDAASSHATPSVGKSIGAATSDALCMILEEAPWGLEEGKTAEEQDTNVSLKGIKDAIRETISILSARLQSEGLEDDEYDTTLPRAATPRKSTGSADASSTPFRHTNPGQGNVGRVLSRRWTDADNLELLRVLRDVEGTREEKRIEFNRRRQAQGVSAGEARTKSGFRQQLEKLRRKGTTIAELETAGAAALETMSKMASR